MNDEPLVIIDKQAPLMYLTLNRASKRNALNAEMVAALVAGFELAANDEQIRAVILSANGNTFCSGADLESIQNMQTQNYEQNLADSMRLRHLFAYIYGFEKPVVAAVGGSALAGGCGLAGLADFTFASPEAVFAYTEVRIGFVPAIVAFFLIRKLGEAKARTMLLSGQSFSASQALDYGFIYRICPAEQLIDQARNFAVELCKTVSGQAFARTKKLLNEVQDFNQKAALDLCCHQNAVARQSQDCKKGIAKFLNKEKIDWNE